MLRDLEHPCPNGCGQGGRRPAGKNHQVIEVAGDLGDDERDRPARRRGRADQANDVGGEFVATALEAWGFSDRD
ncbi:hypothetical protein [Kibdelosporangium persicum]|uniref:hypothetical protein n=1 Tax=Kibdelosporangium persicum TaxID=2698649 RepID=UPI001FE77A7C|nr:hypothetical protein [Kibdelosporangium persicum]